MAALTAFRPHVAVDCPGVPNPVMDDAIRRGAREFCKKTDALTVEVTQATTATLADYAPTMAADTEIIAVEKVYRARSSTLISPEYLTLRTQDWVDAQPTSSDSPSMYCVLDITPVTLRVYPTPSAVETLTVKVSFMPTITATTLDDRLSDWYLEAVTAYAKYWLMIQPEKPWSSPDKAAFVYRQFDSFASAAIITKAQGRAHAPLQVQMRPFA